MPFFFHSLLFCGECRSCILMTSDVLTILTKRLEDYVFNVRQLDF